ncbi:UNVERIFIED_CONTAM: hypothetical protein FKN15_071194 [Acipenser sinensis]
MVFESVVVDVLNRFLGDYVVNLDSSQLKLGIWGEKLELKIPWKNLYNQSVEATLAGVYLLIVPTASMKYDAEKEEKQLQEARQKELQRIEETKLKAEERDETSKLFFKLVRLDNLFAYWNVNSELYSNDSSEEALGNLKNGVAMHNLIPEGYDFIFRPISAKAKLRMNPRSDVDFSSPKMDLDVNLQEVAIELNRPQYLSILELLGSVDMMSRNLPYRKFRPEVPVHSNAKLWWKYVTTCIFEVNVKPRHEMWSWKHIRRHRQKVRTYKELYKMKITTKKPTEELFKLLQEPEKTLDIFNITLARQQAEMEASKAGLKIYRPGVKVEEEESGGWLGWMWSWSGEKQEDKETKSGGLMYVIETQKILDLKINLMASYIIVPQTGFYTSSENLLVLDLGHLKVTSKSRKGLPQLTVGQSCIEDIMSRAYDSFDVELSSLQLLYSKPEQDWKNARKSKQSSLHILEPVDLRVDFSRAMVVSDPRMPKFKIFGELPLLSVRISDEKVRDILALIDSIPLPKGPPAQSASNAQSTPQHPKYPVVMTPQLTPRNQSLPNLRSSIVFESESEEEFYDAPSSPVEDLPFFEAQSNSLKRKRNPLKKQESVKNMTNFQLRFEISEVSIQLCRLSENVELTVLHLYIEGLGTELKLRSFDLSSSTFLKEICLKCPEYMAPKKSKFEDVIGLHVLADLSCLKIYLRRQKGHISEISIEGLVSQVIMRKNATEILAKLKNIVILDCDEDALYKKAVSIAGKEVFSFKMISHVDATEGNAYTDMNIVDSCVTLTVGCIQVIFVNKFVSSILLVLSQEDLTVVLRTLNENIGDSSCAPAASATVDKSDNVSTKGSQTSEQNGGTTVITAAVVETQNITKLKTTLKLDFQFDSLTLELYSPNGTQVQELESRDEQLKLAEFKLGLISTAVTMLSDSSMKASVKLANCLLDDKRQRVQKATPRMVEMKPGLEKNWMVDISYRQGRDGTVLDTVIRDLILCASMEFLLTVADVFVKASQLSSAADQKKKLVTTATKEQAPLKPVAKMEMNVVVKNPEIVFVADLTRADAPALVVTTQCEVCIKNDPETQQMTAAIKDLKVVACPFLREMRKNNITTVLQPCDVFFQSSQTSSTPQKIELIIKCLTLKVSPIIINTVITITSALSPAAETPQELESPVPLNLWDKKQVKDLKLWFLEEDHENKNSTVSPLVPQGESLKMTIESIFLTLEAGVGHRTVPMLLAKSAFSCNVKNWSTLINLQSLLNLEVHYYNEVMGVWEPLLEPLDEETSDNFRPWTLGIKMKKKPVRYFKVLIQEMGLKLDLGFLYALSELFTQDNADEASTEQKVELFEKDIEYLKTELNTVSTTDTSAIGLYEYFHISPIKLHLSLSLSTGGEDGNKERRQTEVIPVQSLNLLLKSIGATLTDAQDVVFKLAFFELTYQFCTTQQLQWEVIRHYSKQAIKQMYVLVLGLDVLGNPFGLIRGLSEGFEAFFYEPYQGAIQGPEEFAEGMALGVKALVGGAVGGLAGAASRITGAMAKGIAAMTLDEEYQQKRREEMNTQPSGLREGITRGGKGLVSRGER